MNIEINTQEDQEKWQHSVNDLCYAIYALDGYVSSIKEKYEIDLSIHHN
jgi:hypothetical protein